MKDYQYHIHKMQIRREAVGIAWKISMQNCLLLSLANRATFLEPTVGIKRELPWERPS